MQQTSTLNLHTAVQQGCKGHTTQCGMQALPRCDLLSQCHTLSMYTFKKHDLHEAFKEVRSYKEGFKPSTEMCKDVQGNISANCTEIR